MVLQDAGQNAVGLVHLNEFDPTDNQIEGNVLTDNTLDLYFEVRVGELSSNRNCFTGNDFVTSLPASIEALLPCDGSVATETDTYTLNTTINPGAVASVIVDETIDPDTTPAYGELTINGETFGYASFTGSTFTLQLPLDGAPGAPSDDVRGLA